MTGSRARIEAMCRNIKILTNFEPPATDEEIRASALQFVRKLSGMNRPSRANQHAFDRAVGEVTEAAHRLIHALTTSASAIRVTAVNRNRYSSGLKSHTSADRH